MQTWGGCSTTAICITFVCIYLIGMRYYVPEIGVMSSLLLGSSFLLCVLHMLIMFILFSTTIVYSFGCHPTSFSYHWQWNKTFVLGDKKQPWGVALQKLQFSSRENDTISTVNRCFYWAHFPDSMVSILSQQENQFGFEMGKVGKITKPKGLLQDNTLEDQRGATLFAVCLRIISLGQSCDVFYCLPLIP